MKTAVDCEHCGTGNRDGAAFCRGCGRALSRRCASCGAELIPDSRFCDGCGSPVDATVPPAAPTVTAGAVRKTVTVLFADLGGSTGFGERTDPEISRQVLARYHALLQDVVDAHRGTVAKFMGDGMMATFGIPEVAEDDARRAVDAGTTMQHRFEAFAADVLDRYGETLTMRVGINTGEVVIASGDADLVGDALNVAARLEKACRPGHVLVGDETWRITRGDLAYEPLGEVMVAGRAGPVSTYEVIASGAATADPVAPFVGRVGETNRLRAAFDRARTDAGPVLVTVLGSPGMGKTRLSRELASALAADEEATTFEIRCDRSGGATFAPFADLVREAAGLAEIEDGEDAAEVTRDRIGALVHDDADRSRVVDVIAGVLGAAPARSVEETFWGIRRIVESLATERPLVVVIDDIQWAEPKLLDLLEHLAEWVHAAAVLLVCLARPELRELRPALTEPGRRVAEVLALDGLDASATAELASGLLGSALPSELIDRLPVSTDGNPLFVRELVRMLVDDAVIRRRANGTWELAIDAEAIEVPPTIQSLLATRVERLPTEELRVLELASVVGAEFSVGALRELAGDDLAVPPVLERLRRKELVEPTGSYWGDDPLHRFHHVLIRDAAYRRLLKTTRAELHRRVGEWTDAIAADLVGEQETAIAFHYEQAHRYRMELGTADEETDRLGRRAAELLTVAARRALDREDLTAAGALARRALRSLPEADIDDRADLLLIACECFLSSGDVAGGAPLVGTLDALAGGNEQLEAWAACYRAQLIGLTDPDGVVAAEEMANTAASVLASLGDGAGEAKAHQVRALLLARLGRVGEAEAVLDLALGAARMSDDRRRVTAVLGAAPQAALFGPSPVARAGGRCLDVVRLLRITTASPSVEATSMRCQAVLEALRGRFDVSRSMLASARASLEELGLRHGLLETDLFTGMVEIIAGDPGAAIDPLRSAYEGLGTLGVGADAGQAAALLATALLARGEIDEADLMAGESEALAGQNLKTAIAWRIARAEVHAARGDAAAGVRLAEEAVQIAAGTDLILDHADACVVLADLSRLSGDAPGAERARDEARRLYEAKGATVPAARLAGTSPIAGTSTEAPDPRRVSSMSAPPADPRTAACENTATRVVARLTSFVGSAQDPPADLISPALELQDRRSLVGLATADAAAIGENFAIMRDQGYNIAPLQPLAVRGERLALHRTRARTPAGDETVLLSVDEVDTEGRVCRLVWFDDTDLANALVELDERYMTGEGAPFATMLRARITMNRLNRERDWDAYRASLIDDFRYEDHRPLGFGSGGPDDLIEVLRAGVDLAPDMAQVTRKLFAADRVGLTVLESRGHSDDGGAHEWMRFGVTSVADDGRIEGLEWFAEDDFEAALARFDELGSAAADPRTPVAENTATRVHARACAAIIARRADDLRPLITRDFVQEDRRTLIAFPTLGRRGLAENFALMHDQGYVSMVPEPIAVRGERLCLDLVTARTEAGDESALLALVELDDVGREIGNVVFDAEDLPTALVELDARYAAGEGAPYAAVLREGAAMIRLHRERDWDTYRASLTDDFRFEDHRPLGFGSGGPDELIEVLRSGVELAPDLVQVARKMFVAERVGLAVLEGAGRSADGGAHEWLRFSLTSVTHDGRLDGMEWFAEDDFEAALARFDALSAAAPSDTRSPLAENLATRVHARILAAISAGDTEGQRALTPRDFAQDDRRAVVGVPNQDRRGIARYHDIMLEQGYEILPPEPLAVRGDRLTLSRVTHRTATGDESILLALIELDADGLIARATAFDEADLDAARDELDERFLAGEGAEHEYVVRRMGDFRVAQQRRDWAAVEALVADDFVLVDHRSMGLPERDCAGYVGVMRASEEQTPDQLLIHRSLVVCNDAVLARTGRVGSTPDGLAYEWEQIAVMVWAAGRLRRVELFSVDDATAAQVRFEQLAERSRIASVDNRLVRRTERNGWLSRHTDDQPSSLAADCVLDDRRVGVNAGAVTGDVAVAASIQSGIDVFGALDLEPLAVRGDRLALFMWAFVTDGGFEAPGLCVIEVGDDDLTRGITSFDDSDLASATNFLETRHAELQGDALTIQERATAASEAAFNARDWDALAALFTPDVRYVNHTPLGDEGGVDEYVANLQVFAEQVPTAAIVYAKVTSSNRAGLSVLPFTGTTPEGNRYSWTLYQATLMDEAGRMSRFEIFGDDRWDDAVALFEQWAAESEVPTRDAPVTKWPAEEVPVHEASTDGGPASSAQPVSAAFAARDWDWIRARVAPDMALEDRRSTVSSHRAVGADAVVDLFRGFADVGFETLDNIHLASRGDRLALLRRVYRTATGFELEMLVVVETHVDGLMASLVLFDAEALVPALDELEVRYARSGAMNRTERPVLIGFAALNHRHWRELDAVQSPSVEVVDHRRLGFPASTGPTGLVLALESLVTQVPDVVAIVAELETSGPAALASVRQVGTSIDGTAADWAWVNVIAIDRNGRIHRLEYFDAEDEPAARARFEELARRGV